MKLTSSHGMWKRTTLLAAVLGVGSFTAGRSFDTFTVAATSGEFALLTQDGPPPPDGGDEDRPPPPPRHGPPPPPPLVVALDKDRDGELSAKEITGAAEALKSLDKDKDGILSHEEMRPEPPPGAPRGDRPDGPPPPRGRRNAGRDGDARRPGPRDDGPPPPPRGDDAPPPRRERGDGPPPPFGFDGRPPVPPLFKALDKDKDGELSAKEIAAASESLKTLDEDGDGVLSHEEMRPAPPDGPPPGRRPREGQGRPPRPPGDRD